MRRATRPCGALDEPLTVIESCPVIPEKSTGPDSVDPLTVPAMEKAIVFDPPSGTHCALTVGTFATTAPLTRLPFCVRFTFTGPVVVTVPLPQLTTADIEPDHAPAKSLAAFAPSAVSRKKQDTTATRRGGMRQHPSGCGGDASMGVASGHRQAPVTYDPRPCANASTSLTPAARSA